MSVKAMEQALEALEFEANGWEDVPPVTSKAIKTLREAIEQAESFGYFQFDLRLDAWVQNRHSNKGVAFYTTPPPRQPLTHPQIHELDWPDGVAFEDILLFTRAIEAAHGIRREE